MRYLLSSVFRLPISLASATMFVQPCRPDLIAADTQSKGAQPTEFAGAAHDGAHAALGPK